MLEQEMELTYIPADELERYLIWKGYLYSDGTWNLETLAHRHPEQIDTNRRIDTWCPEGKGIDTWLNYIDVPVREYRDCSNEDNAFYRTVPTTTVKQETVVGSVYAADLTILLSEKETIDGNDWISCHSKVVIPIKYRQRDDNN